MYPVNQLSCLQKRSDAVARISGSGAYPGISGLARFYQETGGVLLVVSVRGLPNTPTSIYGFHIHAGSQCTGNAEDPFADTDGHLNPDNVPHPQHAGDLPPLFGNHGCAFMSVLTDRFSVSDILGRTLVIHISPDDFTTQPSGNSGKKIACGQILRACARA